MPTPEAATLVGTVSGGASAGNPVTLTITATGGNVFRAGDIILVAGAATNGKGPTSSSIFDGNGEAWSVVFDNVAAVSPQRSVWLGYVAFGEDGLTTITRTFNGASTVDGLCDCWGEVWNGLVYWDEGGINTTNANSASGTSPRSASGTPSTATDADEYAVAVANGSVTVSSPAVATTSTQGGDDTFTGTDTYVAGQSAGYGFGIKVNPLGDDTWSALTYTGAWTGGGSATARQLVAYFEMRANTRPTAAISLMSIVGLDVTVDVSGITDPNQTLVDYRIDWGDGAGYGSWNHVGTGTLDFPFIGTELGILEPTPSNTYAVAANYVVTVQARDVQRVTHTATLNVNLFTPSEEGGDAGFDEFWDVVDGTTADSPPSDMAFPDLNDVNDTVTTSASVGSLVQWDGAEWVSVTTLDGGSP